MSPLRRFFQQVRNSRAARKTEAWEFLAFCLRWRKLWGIGAIACLCCILLPFPATSIPESTPLPALQVHPLPATLTQLPKSQDQSTYAEQIQATPVGALIWTNFPVKVYIALEPQRVGVASPMENRQALWQQAVTQAVQDWNAYLPLVMVDHLEEADIDVSSTVPQIQREKDGTGRDRLVLPRIRSGETRYELTVNSIENRPTLGHRCHIILNPRQAPLHLQASARHELGHALGLWGHSPQPTDVLYFAQVRQPPPISARDLNTLQWVYRQPTRLGWPLPSQGL